MNWQPIESFTPYEDGTSGHVLLFVPKAVDRQWCCAGLDHVTVGRLCENGLWLSDAVEITPGYYGDWETESVYVKPSHFCYIPDDPVATIPEKPVELKFPILGYVDKVSPARGA